MGNNGISACSLGVPAIDLISVEGEGGLKLVTNG
jgi:hypothetical protein